MGLLWDLEPVVFRVGGERGIPARLLQRRLSFLIEHVAHALVEKQRENELLVVTGVNRPPQEGGRAPEVGFELLLGDAGHSRLTNLEQGFLIRSWFSRVCFDLTITRDFDAESVFPEGLRRSLPGPLVA